MVKLFGDVLVRQESTESELQKYNQKLIGTVLRSPWKVFHVSSTHSSGRNVIPRSS